MRFDDNFANCTSAYFEGAKREPGGRLQDHFSISVEFFSLVEDALQLIDFHVYCLEGGRTASLGKQVNRVLKWKALN